MFEADSEFHEAILKIHLLQLCSTILLSLVMIETRATAHIFVTQPFKVGQEKEGKRKHLTMQDTLERRLCWRC